VFASPVSGPSDVATTEETAEIATAEASEIATDGIAPPGCCVICFDNAGSPENVAIFAKNDEGQRRRVFQHAEIHRRVCQHAGITCQRCASKMTHKICPICRAEFSDILTLRKDDKVKSQEKAGKIFDLFDTDGDEKLTGPQLRALIEVISPNDPQRHPDISAFKNGITRRENFITQEIAQSFSIVEPEGVTNSLSRLPSFSNARPSALQIVSSIEEFGRYQDSYPEARLAVSMDGLIEMGQADRTIVGMSSSEWFNDLGSIFSYYHIPIGLMSKLMDLQRFDALHFVIDDSGSMSINLAGIYPRMSRWKEVHLRLKTMMDILSFFPIRKILVFFLNRREIINLQRNFDETPEQFVRSIHSQIDEIFNVTPTLSDYTGVRRAVEISLDVQENVARYFFGDGRPNGGIREINSIKQMIENRTNATENPITFIACSDNDQDVEWMFKIAEAAPNCAALSDYQNEAHEVRSDQGAAFPYTEGFHLIDQLVGVLNPDDIGRLHKNMSLTLQSLNNILGMEYTEEQYRHYFDRFVDAQQNLFV
jgi:hypothetical protein